MAHVSNISAGRVGIMSSLRGMAQSVSESIKLARKFRATFEELNGLTTRELNDIGISRSDITRLAYDATYGDEKEFHAR